MTIDKATKYFKLAKYNAELFSKDPNTKVGAIILSEDFSRIHSTGINGFPRRFNDLIEKRWLRPTKYNYVSHSEINCICNAARTGTPVDGCIMVVTMYPCMNCAKAIIQAGIKKIYTEKPDFNAPKWGEEFKISREMFDEVGVEIFYIEDHVDDPIEDPDDDDNIHKPVTNQNGHIKDDDYDPIEDPDD